MGIVIPSFGTVWTAGLLPAAFTLRNYVEHARELGNEATEDPPIFFYAGSTHLPLEQHAAVAHYGPDGRLTLSMTGRDSP